MSVFLLMIMIATSLAATTTALLVVAPHLKTANSNNNRAVFLSQSHDADAFVLQDEYQQYEQAVTQRGEHEGRLMALSPSRPLLPLTVEAISRPNVDADGGATRGFGVAGGKNKGKKKNNKKMKTNKNNSLRNSEEEKRYANVLKQQGLVRIDHVLSDAVTDELRAFVYDTKEIESNKQQQVKKSAATSTLQATFSTIRRWDLSIPLLQYNKSDDGTTATSATATIAFQAFRDVLQKSPVGDTMARFLGTSQAALYEFSSYISDPKSSRQVVHSDTPCFVNDQQPILCTCFVALQDIRPDMGPTLFLPRTNTQQVHDLFFGEEDSGATATPVKDEFLRTHPSVVGTIPKGSCIIFDSRLLHCGTANVSLEDSRAMLFFSFKHPSISLENPGGDTPSIRADCRGRFFLSDFVPPQ